MKLMVAKVVKKFSLFFWTRIFIILFTEASFRETCQWLKFPLHGLRAQSRVSPVAGLLPLASGLVCK